LNVKKCMCWCLSIIELKNARWNIEIWKPLIFVSKSVRKCRCRGWVYYTGCFCMKYNKVYVGCFVSRYNIAAPVSSKCNVQSMKICTGFSWLWIVPTGSSKHHTENFNVLRRSENFCLYDQQLPQAPKYCITHQLQQCRTLTMYRSVNLWKPTDYVMHQQV